MDTVFWMDLHAAPGNSLEKKFNRLLARLDCGSAIRANGLVGIKVHAGEKGNLAYLNHNYARLVVNEVKRCLGKPFLTDTNTLYSGGRHNAVDHRATAALHGYCEATTGAPFIVADGLRGLDYEELQISGNRTARAKIGSALCQAEALIVLSHFKGHCEMGFGGAIKNLGMGGAAVPGKLELHSLSKPVQKLDHCVACGQCVRRCPKNAIVMKTGKAVIDYDRCVGCGQCIAACNYGAMRVKWGSHGETLLKKVAAYAGALHARYKGKARYINFALSISPDCDCWDYNDRPIVQDVGILVSANPAALDRATLDMVASASAAGRGERDAANLKGNPFDAIHGTKSEALFAWCRSNGMDDRYRLEKVE
ncbi:MAG: DUF362 domain-containing protein [Chitinispirillaceae bacterium]|nr:DUF362 domain-containing protein [Chitinispirillaceae bacterium]